MTPDELRPVLRTWGGEVAGYGVNLGAVSSSGMLQPQEGGSGQTWADNTARVEQCLAILRIRGGDDGEFLARCLRDRYASAMSAQDAARKNRVSYPAFRNWVSRAEYALLGTWLAMLPQWRREADGASARRRLYTSTVRPFDPDEYKLGA